MAFADDLLEQAYHLLSKDHPNPPKQASLRRAVSTAYYALFHLLIDEAVGNWSVARQRGLLARSFEHRAMKKVCDDRIRNFYSSSQPAAGIKMKGSGPSVQRVTAEAADVRRRRVLAAQSRCGLPELARSPRN
jgi:hypothetical protein